MESEWMEYLKLNRPDLYKDMIVVKSWQVSRDKDERITTLTALLREAEELFCRSRKALVQFMDEELISDPDLIDDLNFMIAHKIPNIAKEEK